MQNKLRLLKQKIAAYDRLAVAFSGGVDSTFLLLCAREVLREGALAVTVTGPNFAPDEIEEAKKFCAHHEIPHLIINMKDELLDILAPNSKDRCYLCKKSIFGQIMKTLDHLPIADGTNADDAADYRPGRKALKEMGIISPLEDVGFTKEEIRSALKAMNISTWDKPAYACLASRIPYGEPVTEEKLTTIYKIESAIRQMGFPQVRLRHHGDIARIELPRKELGQFCSAEGTADIITMIKDAGFAHATLDLDGYVMGSLNYSISDPD
ncbi:MAG: ATP-dependent sacrificial sulfur transferase LarE [Anaerovoracaceae bacterium]|jgi:uncharacterized protein